MVVGFIEGLKVIGFIYGMNGGEIIIVDFVYKFLFIYVE